jgi:AcrB/AcrD/AcrF family protein
MLGAALGGGFPRSTPSVLRWAVWRAAVGFIAAEWARSSSRHLAKQLDARVEVVRNPDRDDGRIWFVTDLHSGKEKLETQTTLSIPSLMGAIMSIGVASANSILLVTFAREHREATGCSAVEAAIMAGRTRLRPVLMTAGCRCCSGSPRAAANAALARAVLGGIPIGTCFTCCSFPSSMPCRGEARCGRWRITYEY